MHYPKRSSPALTSLSSFISCGSAARAMNTRSLRSSSLQAGGSSFRHSCRASRAVPNFAFTGKTRERNKSHWGYWHLRRVGQLQQRHGLGYNSWLTYSRTMWILINDKISFWVPTLALTQQVSDGYVYVHHVLGQQWRPVCVAVVFHQGPVQQQLALVQTTLGETRPLITAVGRAGHRLQRLHWSRNMYIVITLTVAVASFTKNLSKEWKHHIF